MEVTKPPCARQEKVGLYRDFESPFNVLGFGGFFGTFKKYLKFYYYIIYRKKLCTCVHIQHTFSPLLFQLLLVLEIYYF